MPKVSILVPNYNYARFLDQRLGTIERQTYRDFEVILLDDASTDDSVQILKQFAREHGCRLVCNEHKPAAMLPGKLFQDLHAVVGRSIVEQDHFEIPVRLPFNGSQPLIQKARVVVVWHEDRNFRHELQVFSLNTDARPGSWPRVERPQLSSPVLAGRQR